MAFVVGNRVSLHVPVDTGSPHTIFTFGTVSDYAAPSTLVMWDNGLLSLIVPDEQLDLIIPTDLPGGVGFLRLSGGVENSAERMGLIVGAYFRQAGGDDAASGPYYLLKLFGKPGFMEVLSSQIEIVRGR